MEKTTAGLGSKDKTERAALGRQRKSCLICRHTGGAASIQATVGGRGCLWAPGTGQDGTTWQGPGMRWERFHLKEEQFCTTTGHTAQLGAEGGDRRDIGI